MKYIVFYLIAAVYLIAAGGTLLAKLNRAQAVAARQTQINAAYSNLLHKIWIDNPNYVDDVISESDEFAVLDSLHNGDWEDTFEFWSESDSINYLNNQE